MGEPLAQAIRERMRWFERAGAGEVAPFLIVDGGAHAVEGQVEIYAPLAAFSGAGILGFEPNAAECERLNREASGARRRYVPAALGDGKPGRFHSCRYALTSSLLAPNMPLLRRYENLAELCEVLDVAPMDTVRLDDVEGTRSVDFLKLDVQGATLDVLEGAERVLAGAPVLHLEVEFQPIYRGQRLFSEVEIFLRERGFVFHHFHSMEGRRAAAAAAYAGRSAVQMLWADAVFVPGFDRIEGLDGDARIKLAATLDLVYGAHDLAAYCLSSLPPSSRSSLLDSYLDMLRAQGIPVTR